MDCGSYRNTPVLGEDFVRRFVAEAFSRSMVEQVNDIVEFGLKRYWDRP